MNNYVTAQWALVPIYLILIASLPFLSLRVSTWAIRNPPLLEVLQESFVHAAFFGSTLAVALLSLVVPEAQRPAYRLPVVLMTAAIFLMFLFLAWIVARRRLSLEK